MRPQSKAEHYLTTSGWVFAYSYKPGVFGGAQQWRDPQSGKLYTQRMAVGIQRLRNKREKGQVNEKRS